MNKIISFILSITIVFSTLIIMPVGHAENTDIAGWTFTTLENGEYILTNASVRTGANSLLFTGDNSKSKVTATTNFKAEKDKTYKFGFWIKMLNSSSFTCKIGKLNVKTTPVTTKYDWTYFETEYDHSMDNQSIDIVFELSGIGRVYIDDLYVAKKDSRDGNVLLNPGFENNDAIIMEDPDGLIPYTMVEKDKLFNLFGDKKSMPLLYMDDFECDGSLNEWEGYASASLPNEKSRTVINTYGGNEDLSAEFMTAYDDENLYISATVVDDIHFQNQDGSNYWQGDSVQIAVGTPQEDFGIEIGFYVNTDGISKAFSTELEKNMWGVVDDFVLQLREDTKCSVIRNNNITTYEMVIPWRIKFDEIPEDFLFNILINDNDGNGRKGYIEWTNGIGAIKSNKDFIAAIPISKNSEVFGYIDGEKSVFEQTGSYYRLYVVNASDVPKNVSISTDGSDTTNVEIPSNRIYYHPFIMREDIVGNKKLKAILKHDENEFVAIRNIAVNRKLNIAFPRFEKEKLSELKELQTQCKNKKINTDYEDINISTIEMFINYGLEDFNGGREFRAEYVYVCLENLYEETKTALNSYLDGTAKPKTAYYYAGGETEIKNKIFYSDMENSETGVIENRPMFFSGYCGSAIYADEMIDVGANIIQFEVPMYNYMSVGDANITGWKKENVSGAGLKMSLDSSIKKNGKYSLKLTNEVPLAAYRYGDAYQSIALEKGKTYQFSLYAKAKNISSVSWIPLGFASGTYPTISLAGNYDWKKFTYEYKAEEDRNIDMRIVLNDAGGELYIDDVKIVEKGTKKNLILNGDFETEAYKENGYTFDTARAQKDVVDYLDKCEELNMAVDLLFSVHYFPTGIMPSAEYATNNNYFLRHNIYSPEVQKLTGAFIAGITQVVAEHPALNSICLSNEPVYRAGRDESNAPEWHEYLREIYSNDVNFMNTTWQENFDSFEDVPMQEIYDNPKINYDYLMFNDKMFAQWHKWQADIIRKYAPDIPLHTKMMSVIGSSETHGVDSALAKGTNPELFKDFLDINGNDSWNFVRSTSSRTGITKSFWYDLQASLKNAPCFNSEDHVIEDRDENYGERYAPHVAADLWQGAIHGRSATTVWVWARTLATDNDVSANIKHRPDAVAMEGKTMLDLNRLSYEIEAIQNEPANVAIMYSHPSRIYNLTTMNAIYQAYEKLTYNGIKSKFVTESSICENGLENIKLLVLANNTSTTPETVKVIKDFVNKGGKIIVLGDSMLYDDHMNEFANRSDIEYILSKAQCVSGKVVNDKTFEFEQDLGLLFRNAMKEIGKYKYEIIDVDTGKNLETAEWTVCEYNGKTILNLCHYDWGGDVRIEIKKDGTTVKDFVELRSGEKIKDTITLKTSYPILLEF